MKSFFKEDTSLLTEEGAAFQLKLDKYFEEVFKEYISKGYSLREIPQLIYSSVSLRTALESIKVSDEIEDVKKKERIRSANAAKFSKVAKEND